jgi:hypothetical protein
LARKELPAPAAAIKSLAGLDGLIILISQLSVWNTKLIPVDDAMRIVKTLMDLSLIDIIAVPRGNGSICFIPCLYEREIPAHFLEASVSRGIVTLYGVVN